MPRAHQRRLGQYFTPLPVVDFALDALARLAEKDAPSAGVRRVIDPACGDGVFLARAVERGLVAPQNAFGLDKDEGLLDAWAASGLNTTLLPTVAVGDGLLASELAGVSPLTGAFDWVVGNPPYAGDGLKGLSDEAVVDLAGRYELMRARFGKPNPPLEQLRRVPIEVLFVERFVGLCRPGGLVAVVLPVGIFANERWRYVRRWLLERLTVHAVVGLPRTAFRGGATTAKTCLAFARNTPPPGGHQVALAEAGRIGLHGSQNDLPEILHLWRTGGEVALPETPWTLSG